LEWGAFGCECDVECSAFAAEVFGQLFFDLGESLRISLRGVAEIDEFLDNGVAGAALARNESRIKESTLPSTLAAAIAGPRGVEK